jgi:transketolase
MALEGLTPVVYSITPFLLERPFEQIKIGLNHQKTNVKLIGYADYPGMGPTHSELDWKTISQCFENIKFFFPIGHEDEARRAILEAYNFNGPAVVSLKKAQQT